MKSLIAIAWVTLQSLGVQAAPQIQYFYGSRTIGSHQLASVLVKRTVDREESTVVEEITDCDHNVKEKNRIQSYRVDFKIRKDGFYTLEEKLQSAFKGTGQMKNPGWIHWTSHTFSETDGWTLVSDDQVYQMRNGRIGLKVTKIFTQGSMQVDMNEDFIEIAAPRYDAILKTYHENSNSTELECAFE